MLATLQTRAPFAAQRPAASRCRLTIKAAAWQKATTKDALKGAGGKTVVELAGQKVLVVDIDDTVYAVSNKCSHLGLPLVGKTSFFQGQVRLPWSPRRF